MKHYKILSFVKTENGNLNRYDLVPQSGSYFCPTLNDIKTESDFCCEQNCFINSVIEMTNNRLFEIGRNGVTHIRLKNSKIQVKYSAQDWTFANPRTELQVNNNDMATKKTTTFKTAAQQTLIAKPVVSKAAAPIAPSRSTIDKEKKEVFEILQSTIEKQADIRLDKFMKKNLPSTVKEFLINFFTKYNMEKNTIYVLDKTIQTDMSRRRSMGDIFKICKYYFPEVTLKEIIALLFNDLKKTAELKSGFRYSYCTTIKKRVFYYVENKGILEENSKDEYGNHPEFYKSKI